jgi:hypothetical protein
MNGTICPTFAQQLHSGKQQAAIRLQQRQISPIVRGNDFSSGETGAPIQITHPYLLQRRMMLRKFSAAGVMALSTADGGSLKNAPSRGGSKNRSATHRGIVAADGWDKHQNRSRTA